ncbi:nitrate- and nitrite sensing domain-containing protein [Actinomadura verrucosospora]|uniref:nitrate- and nitrite sensing domain-containing protein n=1 Tax=Actinomadura verrucosospora TaxID=46165 RepID=UPI001564E36B|nr:nitrate- and nitrite sensing domain-containing protein [Actinomadura verrucosospora]
MLGGRLKLRNWRVTTRLFALIAVPTVVAALLAGYRVSVSMDNAESYGRTGKMATLGEQLTALAHEMENERDAMAEHAANHRAVTTATLKADQARTDAAAAKVRAAASAVKPDSAALRLSIGNVVNRVDDLASLRTLAIRLAPGPVVDKYTEFIDDFASFHLLVSQDAPTPELAQSALALADLARAKDAASRERALIASALWAGRFEPLDRTAVDDARAEMNTSITAFRSSATPAQLRLYEDTVTGPELDRAEVTRLETLARADASRQLMVPLSTRTARSWTSDAGVRVDRMRTVEQKIATDLADTAGTAETDAQTAAVRDGSLLFLVLAVVLVLLIIVARSLVRPLRRLQTGALEVASSRLPGLVDRLRDPEAAAGGIEVAPIEIDSTDEIGQVARAFDEVHREAVRLAADEAVLRGNINAMFVNLSRRSQSLIERQLKLIEELEQSERDEEQLSSLFRLDHLATRMRRNCENLLVLGGQEQARRWNKAVPLIDVVRASLSEVEQYERVALRVQGDMTVAGPVVNDLVHLLAELVENALVFSSEHTKVTVSGQLLSGGGSMLQITDNGVGMSPEELEQANWRLANPPVIDFSAARRMGLFVVGRLAVRHGIRVELRAAQGGGLTAFVVLPDAAVTPGEPAGVGARGLGARDAGGQGQLAALTSTAAEPPAVGAAGSFRQDDFGPAAGLGAGTGGNPMVGHTGPLRPLRGATGPQPMMGGHGPGDGAGPQSPLTTGPLPTGPLTPAAGTGAHAAVPGTGPLPAVPQDPPRPADAAPPNDAYGADRPSARSASDLPVRRPGAQLRGRQESGRQDNVFQPRSERTQNGASGNAAAESPMPGGASNGYRENGFQEPGNGFRGAGGRHTGPQPVVPEAQPVVPEPGARRQQIPWETGPLDQVGDGMAAGPRDDGSRNGAPVHGRGAAQPPREAVPEPSGYEQNGYEQNGYEQNGYEQGGRGRPAPAAHQAPPPAPAGPKPPPRVPERSPIFDAMQSEWFQRRTGGDVGEDPVKGWESPADEGFRAAEAVREPVAGSRTQVGLPKRVPGRNRIPGAVGKPPAAGGGQPQAAPAGGGTQPAPRPGAPVQDQQSSGQSADVVRNRFASLQRGVHRGRNEARGGGTSGEVPSQGDGETGGTR